MNIHGRTQVQMLIKVTFSHLLDLQGSRPFTNRFNNTGMCMDICCQTFVFTFSFTESNLKFSPCLLYLCLFLSLCAPNLMQVSHCLSPLLSSHRTTMPKEPREQKKTAHSAISVSVWESVCLAVREKRERKRKISYTERQSD